MKFLLSQPLQQPVQSHLVVMMVSVLLLALPVQASAFHALTKSLAPLLTTSVSATAYQQLSFRTLRLYIPGKKPPQDVMEYNGKSVEVMGFMAALTQLEEIDEFVLASSPPMNCFCHPPLRVNEVVFVQMKKGKKTDYKGGVVRIRGKLTVNMNVGDEFADIMYTIECDEIV
jgi:hypothetical protein